MRLLAALALLVLVPAGCVDRDLPLSADPPLTDIVPMAVVLTVQNLDDDGANSLRQTIQEAGNGHVITFDPSLAGGTIQLENELLINKSLAIHGPPGGITLQGGDGHRVLRTLAVHEVILDNLTIQGGRPHSFASFQLFGGGIYNGGANLTIRNSTIRDNWAAAAGGGIINFSGSLTLINSTVSENGVVLGGPLTANGGGIANNNGAVLLVNSTVSGNSASNRGGGIENFIGSVSLIHSTVAGNGSSSGGGIQNFSDGTLAATLSLTNSIVAANLSSTTANGPDIFANQVNAEHLTPVSASHSLIGSASGFALATDGGGNHIGVDPGLELDGFDKPLLADNGGPTLTHALVDGSPAINSADLTQCTADPASGRDQRGEARPQGAGCDMGAYELVGAAPPPPPPSPSVSALSLDSQGSVDRSTGGAVVRGSITCPSPGPVQLQVGLVQEQKQRGVASLVTATSTVVIDCAGTVAWAAGMTAGNGVFTNGKADASVALVDLPGPGPQAATIQLFWNR